MLAIPTPTKPPTHSIQPTHRSAANLMDMETSQPPAAKPEPSKPTARTNQPPPRSHAPSRLRLSAPPNTPGGRPPPKPNAPNASPRSKQNADGSKPKSGKQPPGSNCAMNCRRSGSSTNTRWTPSGLDQTSSQHQRNSTLQRCECCAKNLRLQSRCTPTSWRRSTPKLRRAPRQLLSTGCSAPGAPALAPTPA